MHASKAAVQLYKPSHRDVHYMFLLCKTHAGSPHLVSMRSHDGLMHLVRARHLALAPKLPEILCG